MIVGESELCIDYDVSSETNNDIGGNWSDGVEMTPWRRLVIFLSEIIRKMLWILKLVSGSDVRTWIRIRLMSCIERCHFCCRSLAAMWLPLPSPLLVLPFIQGCGSALIFFTDSDPAYFSTFQIQLAASGYKLSKKKCRLNERLLDSTESKFLL